MGFGRLDNPRPAFAAASAAAQAAIYPLGLSGRRRCAGAALYLDQPLIGKLAEFFEKKGLAAIKEEDQREQWYDDWLAFQARHRLYAQLICPRQLSTLGSEFDLLRFARFLEVFAYFSPAHGYSLQVSFLGFFAILLGDNLALKQEAAAALERGGLLAFGVSERGHGSDLLGNEFTVVESGGGRYLANGAKYYIGNANAAAMIAILARKENQRSAGSARRAPLVLFALRPGDSKGLRSAQKIRTLGVRSAFVGEFEVKDHAFDAADVIAEGRQAWDAVFGAVTLGKFFLGFGSIGICAHAFEEAAGHLRARVLYGKPVIEMPHIRATLVQAYARLTAMKLYAYRALDYVHAANATDRRYLLFAAVQKAKVSTEGVRVMALLSECVGARGFESETFFEMALRDVQLIPGLESSAHINLGLTVQFMPRYLTGPEPALAQPGSLVAGDVASDENTYLMEGRTGAIHTIAFPHFLRAFRPLMAVENVRRFAQAAKAFQLLVRRRPPDPSPRADSPATLALGQCLATIAYGQLVAENALRLSVPSAMIAAMFQALVHDFSVAALTLFSCGGADLDCGASEAGARGRRLFRRLVSAPRLTDSQRDFVATQMEQRCEDDPLHSSPGAERRTE
ncbi:Acyl-CoA dehydrogenase, short-chain specific [Phycisphaerae bacterium RAS1]|nr:Acyl-CoA dehydrogenase, short-chain specific [Phycisphaerae bacterium RAS1]